MAACRRTEPRRPRRLGREGFTLAEVLVAMVILAVGLLALEAMGIGAARMVARADREGELTELATDRLERALNQVDMGTIPSAATETVGGNALATSVATQAMGTRTLVTVTVSATPPANQSWHLPSVTVVGRAVR
ncbi:type IV pilus modification PilV family protein [Longimicrobium sp.]|uniref:type IV pilus modification PilV family protein n=1 Tax=Longimicrobium sp. TaxID=2029185 RepID=UPI002E3112E5|nr:prepilin-type N-terminal cleavage/methylation domain-containing protein [Longimicrobium sp.]HEX6040740.1 prepilin-type N-terminal cleavage/methylation domain-containing protein [Longimicrobium sp.]